ncbi:MAG: glycosyltransferase family 4 protein [Planctomycetes bacterium]|nr:glycosyltransferase family 4 protein [Planctomycetota bacterium]
MKIAHLTPGTGHFYCGSCLRDHALVKALRHQGHDVMMVPMYLPMVLEEDAPEAHDEVHMGGVNLYLQHKASWWRFLPRFMRHWLDSERFLRWAASKGNMTEAPDLGSLTVSTLRGESGRQRAEVETLVDWLKHQERPDVLALSNVMLTGLVRSIREALHVPIVCTLQGEAPFLDGLPEPHRTQAWDVLRERTRDVDAFIAVSRYTADLMTERLALDPRRVHIVPNGIELDWVPDRETDGGEPHDVPVIGYLARMCRDKGIHTLVHAFLELCRREPERPVRLSMAGVVLREDRPLLRGLLTELHAAGLMERVAFRENVDRATKIELLQSFDILSVPATYGESFGLYVLEALAFGVPVVQPRHGAFSEIIDATGGGVMCEPDDPRSLVDAWRWMLDDRERARSMGRMGREHVTRYYTADRMGREYAALCERILGKDVVGQEDARRADAI